MNIVARIHSLVASLLKREEGQGLAEYGLVLALVAVAAVAGLTALGLAVTGRLQAIATAIGG